MHRLWVQDFEKSEAACRETNFCQVDGEKERKYTQQSTQLNWFSDAEFHDFVLEDFSFSDFAESFASQFDCGSYYLVRLLFDCFSLYCLPTNPSG
jgi:hypothetical protein